MSLLDEARDCDAQDPLHAMRARFALPRGVAGAPATYLAGHSLGLEPLAARELVTEVLADWGELGVRAHEEGHRPWVSYHENLRSGLAELAGARSSEVVAMNSLTINLHLMLASFYRPAGARTRILIEAGAFPSDRYAVRSQIAWHGLDPRTELIELAPAAGAGLSASDLEACLEREGDRIALILWPGVQYLTGQAFELAPIGQLAQRAGCRLGFDLAHAIGNLPLELHASGADFAVWCSYKYLNAGPGAVGGCFVHERHHTEMLPRLSGWWGNAPASRFEMRPELIPAAGADAWQVSNPPILACAPLIASLALFAEAGMARLRAKSLALTGFLERVIAPLDVEQVTPRDPSARGCQLSLRLRGSAGRARRALAHLSRAGVICDFREPDILRVAPVPLYNTFTDVALFAEALAQALVSA